MTAATQTASAQVNFDTRVAQYVALRDKIKKLNDDHKAKMKPYADALEQLNGLLLTHLDQVGADSVRSEGGTVYRTLKKSATLADKGAFWTFVVSQGKFEMLDYKANATAVEDYINEQTKAYEQDNTKPAPAAPPGVNWSTHYEVGVRRPAK